MMARIHRYGDEGTIVSARQKAVAALFVVAVAALLFVPGGFPAREIREVVPETRAASKAPAVFAAPVDASGGSIASAQSSPGQGR